MSHEESQQQARPHALVHFLCAGRMVTVTEGRAAGAIARCPKCGDATVLPPRVADEPACRAFQIQCGRLVG
jgi:uncharacterized protein (DUF983 family)